jgi:replicative DNA helicase
MTTRTNGEPRIAPDNLRRSQSAATVDRLPPHSIEAEQGVLGCILLSPESLADAIERFGPFAEVFYDLRHREIFSHMIKMFARKRGVDLLTLQERLSVADQLEAAGGLAYLTALPDAVPSAANFGYYADIIWEKYRLRKMVQVCTAAVSKAFEWSGDVEELLSQIESDVLGAAEERPAEWLKQIRQFLDLLMPKLSRENYDRSKGLATGIPSGFSYLDKVTGGLHAGEMSVLAARPSCGKTSMGMNIVEHAALRLKVPVGVFSIEMGGEDITLRALCAHKKVNFHHVRTGFASHEDLEALAVSAEEFYDAPVFIDDTPALDEMDLRARARRMVKRHGCRLIVIDYMQLGRSRRARDKIETVSNFSGACKSIAKEMNVAVLVLSQLRRETENQGYREPELSDLRWSGDIEQDADLVMLMYQPEEKQADPERPGKFRTVRNLPDDRTWRINIKIAKQRNGPLGQARMVFVKEYMRFEDRYSGQGKTSRDVLV